MASATTAIITGAASGIGRATALELVERGVTHAGLFDLDQRGLDETVSLLPPSVVTSTHVVDVGDFDAMSGEFSAAIAHFDNRSLDLLVNNAAMMTPSPGFPLADIGIIDRVVTTNLRGVLNGIKLAHAHMKDNGGGSIISTASGAGKVGLPTDPLYAATKAAVINLTGSCAPGFAEVGIRINAVCPGVVNTPMLQADGQPSNIDELLANITLLTAEDIATAIADLAVDPAVTGATPSIHNS